MSVVVASLSEFDDFFAFFNLKPQFKIDRQELESSYLTVQKAVHPDLYATGSESEKRISMQLATFANGAYRTLKDPISRGLYICGKNGIDPQLETNTSMPAEFLMQQMEWREALAQAGSSHEVEALEAEVKTAVTSMTAQLHRQLDETPDARLGAAEAAQTVQRLMFLSKFQQDIDRKMDALQI